ncbi:MAG: hypothetical protein ABSC23_05275 [Bryobacteraceae bacterium]|jgi:uncharacterized membrane protein
MPFCSQCGNAVSPADRYCGRCGAHQPGGATEPPGSPSHLAGDALAGISPRTASILCYIPWIGWIPAIVVLASDRFRHDRAIRFHAFQGLYLFVAWLLDQWVVRAIFLPFRHFQVYGLIALVLLGMQIFMIVKAAHEQQYSLPIFGELAARSVVEG